MQAGRRPGTSKPSFKTVWQWEFHIMFCSSLGCYNTNDVSKGVEEFRKRGVCVSANKLSWVNIVQGEGGGRCVRDVSLCVILWWKLNRKNFIKKWLTWWWAKSLCSDSATQFRIRNTLLLPTNDPLITPCPKSAVKMQSMLALLHSLQETITSASMCDTGGVNAGKAKVEALAAIGYVVLEIMWTFCFCTQPSLQRACGASQWACGHSFCWILFGSLGTGLVAAIKQDCSFVHITWFVCALNHPCKNLWSMGA